MVGGCRKAGFRVQSLVLLGSGGDGRGVGSTQLDDGRQSVVPFGVIVGLVSPSCKFGLQDPPVCSERELY